MFPVEFEQRILAELGDDQARALCAALDSPPPVSIRYNPFKMAAMPQGERIEWSEWGMYLPQRPIFTADPAFHAGTYYVQEASSQFVWRILAGETFEGMRILDLCAAPGGKTTVYSALAGTSGLVVANEVNRQRAAVLADNVRKWGVGNVAVTVNTPERIAESLGAWFDVVAVDAPCSGEGMFRKSEESRVEWSEANVKMCAVRQAAIVHKAWMSLKPGGVFIYSTCTFNREENEKILADMMEWAGSEMEDFGDIGIGDQTGIAVSYESGFRIFRFFPHRIKGEGFCIAVVRKSSDADKQMPAMCQRRQMLEAVDKHTATELGGWVANPDTMKFALVGDTYYGYFTPQYEAVRQVAGVLTTIYSGVAMGQIFKKVLKPDHSLALFHALRSERVPKVELNGEDILKYLRKQDVSVEPFVEGVNLVCGDGYAVGFAKRIGARVNNMYPNSLRILKEEF